MFVEQVMTQRPPSCRRSQPLVAAVRLMFDCDLNAIPVTDTDSHFVGMLSVDDLVRWEAGRRRSRSWLRTMENAVLVAQVMNHEIIAVSAGESITEAAQVMRFVSRSVLPVLDSDASLVGTISARQIASASVREDALLEFDVRDRLYDDSNPMRRGTVNIHVEDGTVTLTGIVASRKQLQALRLNVATIPGVAGVRTEISTADQLSAARLGQQPR